MFRFLYSKIATIICLCVLILMQLVATAQKTGPHFLNFKNTAELQNYFSYKADGRILISGHRGGRENNFPENSIEVMQEVLNHLPAFFEIDPRLTKDSIVVLMHDATIDRTTTGKGELSDFTWEELQAFRLKDSEGNPTPYKIPTLEEVIIWSRGKTVINLDKKDVPMQMIVDLIKKHKAENHVMLTVHTGAQARYYFDRLPGIMLSAFARNEREFHDLLISGVPWENMIAYVGPTINESNLKIIDQLRSYGVRCMVSFAPTHDRLKTAGARKQAYLEEVKKTPDIIESDLPTEVWTVIQPH